MEASTSEIGPQAQAPIDASLGTSSQSRQQPRKLPNQSIPTSPSRHPYPQSMAAAASLPLRSQSPGLHSPASSEIFERNVQEPVPISTLGGELSPAHIPTHVIAEDHIPPALEASVQAITSEELNPDEVEIVTATAHQPAGAPVLEGSTSHADLQCLQSPSQASASLPGGLNRQTSDLSEPGSTSLQQSGFLGVSEDGEASNYAQLDPNDVRRLSFISFKDIVQSEHQQAAASHIGEIGSRDSLHHPPGTSLPERTASPLRSPRSPVSSHSHSLSGGVTTPPLSGGNQVEQSPVRSMAGGAQQHGELTIETLGQALRKTASRDLGGVRSAGMSPTSEVTSAPRSRTNT